MSIYTQYVFVNQLVSPINGYSCRIITKQNIKQFGFESVQELQEKYPEFPLICEETLTIQKEKGLSAYDRNKEIYKKFRKIKQKDQLSKYDENPVICKRCGNQIHFNKRNNKFCSRSCSSKRGPRSEETKAKISSSLAGKQHTIKKKASKISVAQQSRVFFRNCSHCNKLFTAKTSFVKCCSSECTYHRKTFNCVKKTHIKYFNRHENRMVDLHSTWEEEVAKFLDNKEIVWVRPRKTILWNQSPKRRYLPDFYLPDYDIFLDVKNPYKIKTEREKLLKVKKLIQLKVYQLGNMKKFIGGLAPT